MPLVLVTGLPCSGKTYRAQQIAAEFSTRIAEHPSSSRLRVQHLQSHHASADAVIVSESFNQPRQPRQPSLRDQLYNSAKEEKTARAEEFSAIKRALSKDVVVIADGLNYIKGYRYQIWCEAKAADTRCCVVHVAAREDECKAWNNERLKAAGRDDEVEDTESQNEPVQGKDGLVEMLPESHTAIYGDRTVVPTSRSRSSSMDAASDDDERPQGEDTMTLKSLYLRDRPNSAQYEEKDDKKKEPKPLSDPPQNLDPQRPPTAPTTPPPPSTFPPYKPSTLTSLSMRYEPPSPFSRWDTPLFPIPTSDPHPPYSQIWDSLFPRPSTHKSKKALSQNQNQPPRRNETAVKQNAATILPPPTPASALQTLESTTQLVAGALLAAYRASALGEGEGGTLSFSLDDPCLTCEVYIPPGMVLNQPALQRLRRKYTSLQRGGLAHGVESVQGGRKGVVEGFVRFLGREWGDDG